MHAASNSSLRWMRYYRGGRGTVESAALLTRKLFSKATNLAVKQRLIQRGCCARADGSKSPLGGARTSTSCSDVIPLTSGLLITTEIRSQRARLRVNFLPFPPRVRALVKEHIRQGMASHPDQDYRLDQMPYLIEFIRTYLRRHPGAEDLASLTIEDLDAFARTSCIRKTGESRAIRTVHTQLSAVRRFLAFVLEKSRRCCPPRSSHAGPGDVSSARAAARC